MNIKKMTKGIRLFLEGMEVEDLEGQHLKDTPERIVRAWKDTFLAGYEQDPKVILSKKFEDPCEEMVVVKDIPFSSFCIHHLVCFQGTAKIGYIPHGQVIGLSKLARVLDCFAHRMQIQERLTTQVANAIMEELKPHGVGVVLTAEHECMTIRGVKKPGSKTITSCLLGVFRTDGRCRQEFLSF